MLEDVFLCEEELKIYDDELSKRHYSTKFNFLKIHNGIRKGNMHTFLGTSGGGKSTLVRTLILDILQNMKDKNDVVVLWLSEERAKDYVREMYKAGVPYKIIQQVKIYSEQDNLGDGQQNILKKMEWLINEVRPLAFIYDNITTSIEYATVDTKKQDKFYVALKRMSNNTSVPFIVMAHTNAGINENYEALIDQNDIRGSKMPAMLSEFFYIMQSFYVGETRYNTIKLTKFRGNPVEHRLFGLNYLHDTRLFMSDSKMDFVKFSEIFKQRNKLK